MSGYSDYGAMDPTSQNDSSLMLALQAMQNQGQIGAVNAQYAGQRSLIDPENAAQMALQGQGIAGQESLAGIQGQYGLSQTGMETSAAEQEANTAAQAAEYPYQLRAGEFNQIFPLINQQLGSANTSGDLSGKADTTGQPTINASPVWNAQQTARQVNSSNATTDQATATQQKLNTQKTAGQGYSSNAPLLAQLNQSAEMAGNAQKANNTQAINWNSAQGNAQNLLQGQTAQEQQFSNRQNEAIQRQGNTQSYLANLLGASASAMA